MIKKFLVLLLVLVLFAVPFVNSLNEPIVDCGTISNKCVEGEVQPVVDDLVENDYALQDQIDVISNGSVVNIRADIDEQQGQIDNLSVNVSDLALENEEQWHWIYFEKHLIRMNQKDIDDLQKSNKFQWKLIRRNKMDIWVLNNDLSDLKDYITAHESEYLQDSVGGGVSGGWVMNWFEKTVFPYLETIFVKKADLDSVWDKIYFLQAENYLLRNNIAYSEDGLRYYRNYFEALDKDWRTFRAGDYVCDTATMTCRGVFPIQ